MNLGRLCIENRVLGWLIIIIFTVFGTLSFQNLGRYEDPEFTIKDAKVITPYPGASPREVEQEVSDRVESAIQQLGQVKYVTSISTPGQSEITVTIKDHYDKHTLPQVWDELRRKVNDVQTNLPPGAGPSVVNDDYGDVFGIFLAVTGEGFTYEELKQFAKDLRKELLLVPNVAKVNMNGAREEQIFIEFSQSKLAQFGISSDQISTLLKTQNQVIPSGIVTVDTERIRIQPSGSLNTVDAISNLLIPGTKGTSSIYLKDVADIKRGYEEVPRQLIHFNGQPAITLAVALVPGGNIVKLGKAVESKINSMKNVIPAGVEINYIYNQPDAVQQSIRGFLVNLVEALIIVVIVLLAFMGLRSGILIGIILLLTVLGTFCFMYMFHINLQRISLGALIIALGMLVDNALVVVDGILVRTQQGQTILHASDEIVKQTIWPLLAATVVGILAFSGIGLSQDKTGEYVESLFQVILISLLLSWFLAVAIAPMLADYIYKPQATKEVRDPYQNKFYQVFRRMLVIVIHNRKQALLALGVMLGLSAYGFKFILPGFFPNSTTPIFFVDYWLREGTDIRKTTDDIAVIEQHVMKIDGVKQVSSFIGQGAARFMLVYTPESANSSYAQLMVELKDYHKIPEVEAKIRAYLTDYYPAADPKYKKISLGPSPDGKIEARFSGHDANELRTISHHAQTIMLDTPGTTGVRDNWRQRLLISQPQFSETLARTTGITRLNLNQTLQQTFGGLQVGLYRERDELIPIVSRLTELERDNITAMYNMFIWSPVLNANIPIQQVVQGFKVAWDDNRLHRRDRKLTITPSADPDNEPTGIVFDRLQPKIEAMKLPVGYELAWGGEFEAQRDAQVALNSKLPISFILMILVVILLFSKVKQPLIIWLTVPLSIIGVTIGLLLAREPFDFMALLGFLSLTGMLIKNAIVLIDQIDLEIAQGKEKFQAVVDSTVTRVRPVSLAALTTILGVAPLVFDRFFASMAVLIMSGLTFATVLTLFVVPVLYTIFFKIPAQPSSSVTK
jgi:multidrug efflux pump subunit AcrB